MKSPKFQKKGWMIITTLIIIIFIFIYYFLVYVKQQESTMIRNSLRVLTQIGDNYRDLEAGYYKNADVASKGSGEQNPIMNKVDGRSADTLFHQWNVALSHNKLWMKVINREKEDSTYFTIKLEDIFNQNIMKRDDIFDFVAIHNNSGETLYTSNRLGDVHFKKDAADSVSFYEQDLGYDRFYVFSIQLKEVQNIYLSGFINEKIFNNKKREVRLGTIILASISVILVILCLPLIKLKIMSNAERLYIYDVLFSGVSIVFIPAILMLLTIGSLSYFHYSKDTVESELKDFSKNIEKSFNAELGAIISQLDTIKLLTKNVNSLDDLRGVLGSHLPNEKYFDSDSIENESHESFAYRKINNQPLFNHYNLFNAIFWADNGSETKSLLTMKDNTVLNLKLNHRTYVSDVLNDNLITFKWNNQEHEIAIQSIRSVSDGSFEVGVGMKSEIKFVPVLASSGPMRSLMQPLVKNGFGFCIIDTKGNTLFHSDIYKNLNENFMEETEGSISKHLLAQTERFKKVDYNGKDQYVFSRPLNSLKGMNIITFVDTQYVHTKTTISLYTTLALYFVFLVILIIIYAIIYALTYRPTKLKQRVFPFNWIRPYDTDKHRRLYKYLWFFNTLCIFCLLISTLLFIQEEAYLLNSLMIVCVVSMCVNYHLLSINMPVQKRIFSVYYSENHRVLFPMLMVVLSILIKLFWDRITYYKITPELLIWDGFMFILSTLLLAALWSYRNNKFPDFIQNSIKWIRSVHQGRKALFMAYKAYTLSWILLLSLVPIFIIFSITYLKESEIYFKQYAFDYLESKSQWKDKKLQPYTDLFIKTETKNYIDSLIGATNLIVAPNNDTVDYDYVNLTPKKHNPVDTTVETEGFDELYSKIRVPLNQYGDNTSGFVLNKHESWAYIPKRSGGLFTYDDNKWHFASEETKGRWFGKESDFASGVGYIILALLAVMLVVISIMTFVVHRVFGLDFKKDFQYLTFKSPDQFREYFIDKGVSNDNGQNKPIVERLLTQSELQPVNSYNNTMIVGVNASHISVIKNRFQNQDKKGYVFLLMDMYDIDYLAQYFYDDAVEERQCMDTFLQAADNEDDDINDLLDMLYGSLAEEKTDQKNFVVFIEHFEFAYNDPELNKIKLKILERLIDHESIAVNLSSEINPINIYEYYEQEIQRLETVLVAETEFYDGWLELRALLQEFKVDYKKWLNLLGSFTKITVPLQLFDDSEHGAGEESIEESFKDSLKPRVTNLLEKETLNGNYLYNLRSYFDGLFAINEDENSDDYFSIHEDHIIKVQEMSYAYYFSIWNSLSKEERYIVYDIAKDKFVNTNNTDGILDLINKGILVYDHSLRLMNESFTNFVLSKVNSDEALEKELESRKEGSWSKTSAILILVIVALIVFISFGQMSILDDVNTLIGSLAAMFTLFLRVSGLGFKKS